MNLIKRVDINNYEFSQYLINNSCYLNIIYIWGATRSTFIIEYNGKLTNHLLEKLSSKHRVVSKNSCHNIIYNNSMIKNNWIENFWGNKEDRESSFEIIIPK